MYEKYFGGCVQPDYEIQYLWDVIAKCRADAVANPGPLAKYWFAIAMELQKVPTEDKTFLREAIDGFIEQYNNVNGASSDSEVI